MRGTANVAAATESDCTRIGHYRGPCSTAERKANERQNRLNSVTAQFERDETANAAVQLELQSSATLITKLENYKHISSLLAVGEKARTAKQHIKEVAAYFGFSLLPAKINEMVDQIELLQSTDVIQQYNVGIVFALLRERA